MVLWTHRYCYGVDCRCLRPQSQFGKNQFNTGKVCEQQGIASAAKRRCLSCKEKPQVVMAAAAPEVVVAYRSEDAEWNSAPRDCTSVATLDALVSQALAAAAPVVAAPVEAAAAPAVAAHGGTEAAHGGADTAVITAAVEAVAVRAIKREASSRIMWRWCLHVAKVRCVNACQRVPLCLLLLT